jgi:hypothetical protein
MSIGGNLPRFLETSASIQQSQPGRRTIHHRLLQLCTVPTNFRALNAFSREKEDHLMERDRAHALPDHRHRFRLARSIARAISAAIWPWLARKELASAAVTLTTTVIGRGSRVVFSSRTTRSGGTTNSPRCAMIVRIPMRFQRRGGRKRIIAPDGGAIVLTSKPQPDGTLVKALARAWRWARMLESGEYGTLAELADAERISRSYVCRVMRLTLLAPDIVERILDGRPTAGLPHLLKPFPVEWGRQRDRLL